MTTRTFLQPADPATTDPLYYGALALIVVALLVWLVVADALERWAEARRAARYSAQLRQDYERMGVPREPHIGQSCLSFVDGRTRIWDGDEWVLLDIKPVSIERETLSIHAVKCKGCGHTNQTTTCPFCRTVTPH